MIEQTCLKKPATILCLIQFIILILYYPLTLHAAIDSTSVVRTSNADTMDQRIIQKIDTPQDTTIAPDVFDKIGQSEEPDSLLTLKIFDLLTVDNPRFYKEEYKLLTDIYEPETSFDTLFQFYRHEPNKDLGFRALVVASHTSDLSHIRQLHNLWQTLSKEEQVKFRLHINTCKKNIYGAVNKHFRESPSLEYAQKAVNLNETGYHAIISAYRDIRKEMDEKISKAEVEAADRALLYTLFAPTFRLNERTEIVLNPARLFDDLNWDESDWKEYSILLPPLLNGIQTLENPDIIPLIKSQFMNRLTDEELIRALQIAWGNIGRPAVPSMIEAIQDKYLSEDAMAAMATIHDREAIPLLVEALSHEKSRVVRAALTALANMKATEAIPAIELTTKHRAFKVRNAAEETLEILKQNK